MTDKQTEALKIAYVMEQKAEKQKTRLGDYWTDDWCFDAAAELRRLHEVNAELVKVLQDVLRQIDDSWEWWIDNPNSGGFDRDSIEVVIAKATGENNET